MRPFAFESVRGAGTLTAERSPAPGSGSCPSPITPGFHPRASESIARATRSNRSSSRAGVAAGARVARIRASLARADRAGVQKACQDLIDALVAGYRVPKIRVRVLAQRPADDDGELHGLYEPDDEGTPARITVWMRTAAQEGRRGVQDVSAHADPRALPSPRLRALQAAGNVPHRGLLQARVDAWSTRCSRAGVDARAISWV